jgi:hypothetical protein
MRSMTGCRVAALVTALCVCASSTRAQAQQVPYENQLVGERSLGLAGAFVGVADDASAIFHNPAGTATIPTSAVSASLWAVARGTRTVQNGYQTALGESDLSDAGPFSVPMFLAGVIKVGDKSADGVRPHALGAAMFTPLQDDYRFVDQLDDSASVDHLEVRHSDNARWYGLSYGYRPHYGLSFGLSAFYAGRSLSHDEVEIRAREQLPEDSTVGSTYTRASELTITTRHLVLRAGTLLQLTHELNAGIMFQAPGIEFDQESEVDSLGTSVGPDPTAIDVASAKRGRAHLPVPWELRMGLTVLRPPDALMALDFSLFGPDGSSDHPELLAGGDDPPLGLFVPTTIFRRPTLRAAIGFETIVFGVIPLRGGSFFERSSAPEVTEMADSYSVDRVHHAGASLSVGLRSGGYDFAIGATFVVGFGEGLALVRGTAPDAPPRYQATNVNERMLLVFIGGAKSAVRTLVKTLLEG